MAAGDYDYVRSGKVRRSNGTEANAADGINADGSRNVNVILQNPVTLVNLKMSDLITGSLIIASGQYIETNWVNSAGRQVYNGQLSFQNATAYNSSVTTTAEYGDVAALIDTATSTSQYPQLADKSVKGANRLKWRVTNTAANSLTISQWGMTIR
ncbi:hypothetical protein [Paenibacillus humicus]|uniref:hypothetical protein n=1 Tax=Paenibacillus humicus TaxID=412861 RepID=UPI000FD86CC3|nr:hypothetical protein [Paenibacillus humicus]